MTDKWKELPSADSYPGYTEITRAGRSIACVGTGAAVRRAIVEIMEKPVDATAP